MAAYVIGEIEVTDPAGYDDYRKGVLATIEKFGGRFAARGGRVEPLEGGWSPKRLVIVEFPTLEQAQKAAAAKEREGADLAKAQDRAVANYKKHSAAAMGKETKRK